MTAQAPTRKLAAILSADVAGYTRLMRADEAATVAALKRCRELTRFLIEQHSGRVVDTAGDGLLAEFGSAVNAVESAIAVQRALAEQNVGLPGEREMQLRIGVNLGDVLSEDGRIYGDGVNVAARIQNLAEPGGICISGMVYSQIQHVLDLGYDFLGKQKVKNVAQPIPVYRIAVGPEMTHRRRWWLRFRDKRLALAGSLAVLLLIAAVAWIVSARTDGESASPVRQASIAVLPFTNLSQDPEQDYFSDGITSDVITMLSKFPSLFMVASQSVFSYKNQPTTIQEAGRNLGARYIVTGTVRRSGNRMRVTTTLVDASTGYQLWAERYDRELKDIFALQDELTQQIVTSLSVTLTDRERQLLEVRRTGNVEAYDYFLRGQALYLHGGKDGVRQARELFQRAIVLDGSFARAHAGLAMAHGEEYRWLWAGDPTASRQLALAAARRAVDLEPTSSHAYAVLSHVYIFVLKDYEQGVEAGEQAIKLDANNADAYATLAISKVYIGRPAEAIGLVRQAMRLNPHYPYQYPSILGHAYYFTGQLVAAVPVLQDALARNPERVAARLVLAAVFARQGKQDDAAWEVEQVLTVEPDLALGNIADKFPLKDPSQFNVLIEDLRRAGLK